MRISASTALFALSAVGISGGRTASAFSSASSSARRCTALCPASSASVLLAATYDSVEMADTAANSASILVERAKDIVYNKSGFYSKYDMEAFAEDFVFRGPYIGPLNRRDYLDTMDAFGIYNAFPDLCPNAWGFSIDPKDPNRVWFMVRNTGTFNGTPLAPGTLNYQPNGAKLEGCPETFSIIFDEEQKVKYLSVGYVADRFEGNTDGKGAAVGIFHVIGLPFPKVGPVLKFVQYFASEIIRQPPLSYSTDVPEWWTDSRKASDGYL